MNSAVTIIKVAFVSYAFVFLTTALNCLCDLSNLKH